MQYAFNVIPFLLTPYAYYKKLVLDIHRYTRGYQKVRRLSL